MYNYEYSFGENKNIEAIRDGDVLTSGEHVLIKMGTYWLGDIWLATIETINSTIIN